MSATAQSTQTEPNRQTPVWRSLATRPQPHHGRTAADTLSMSTLTEVFCQAQGLKQLQLLVPVLAQLSQQDKWITFIAPPCLPNGRALARAGVDTRKIQIIHTGTIKDYWKTLDDVLQNGQSSAVLCWPPQGEYNDNKRAQMKQTGDQSNTVAFVFRPFGKTRPEAINDSETTEPDVQQLALAL
ncbi:cell division inhibitor SulA [Saccharospirillum impatiens]|uniref:cell division inhibitor SulA n=1 Tax=Saccharospirillum impatiens TaxID=169438 RepID=UPI0006842826|nr:SulA-like leucine-rich domain-containing protein [Saccharospirillum impatiens]